MPKMTGAQVMADMLKGVKTKAPMRIRNVVAVERSVFMTASAKFDHVNERRKSANTNAKRQPMPAASVAE